MTTQKPPKLFQLPLTPEEAERSKKAKNRLHMLKLRLDKRSLFETFEELLDMAEKAEAK